MDELRAQGKQIDALSLNMATLVERLSDYPEVRKDVQSLKRFRAWFVGVITPSAAAGGGLLGYFKVLGGH